MTPAFPSKTPTGGLAKGLHGFWPVFQAIRSRKDQPESKGLSLVRFGLFAERLKGKINSSLQFLRHERQTWHLYIFLERLDQTAKDISSFQRWESRIEITMLWTFGNSRLRAPAQRALYFGKKPRKWRSDFRRLSTNTSHLLRDIMDSRKCCIVKEGLWTAPCVYISPTRHSKIKHIQIENEQPL